VGGGCFLFVPRGSFFSLSPFPVFLARGEIFRLFGRHIVVGRACLRLPFVLVFPEASFLSGLREGSLRPGSFLFSAPKKTLFGPTVNFFPPSPLQNP